MYVCLYVLNMKTAIRPKIGENVTSHKVYVPIVPTFNNKKNHTKESMFLKVNRLFFTRTRLDNGKEDAVFHNS